MNLTKLFLAPYDILSFVRFEGLIIFRDGYEQLDLEGFESVKLDLLSLKKYVPDRGQMKCLERFLEQVSVVASLRPAYKVPNYKSGRYFHEARSLVTYYRKTKAMIMNNSVLFQHFGSGYRSSPCNFEKVGIHKICLTHVSDFNKLHRKQYLEGSESEKLILEERYSKINFFSKV